MRRSTPAQGQPTTLAPVAGWLAFAALLLFSHVAMAGANTGTSAEPIPVTTQTLAELAIYPQYRAPASVVSDNDSRISAEVSAPIIDIPVRVGDVVKKGDVLVRLEQTDLKLARAREEAAIAALQARVELADYQLVRARSLSQKKVVAEELLKQREAELRSLRAQLDGQKIALAQAKRRLQKATVRAPFDASISARLAAVGELASPGSALIQIIERRHVEVSAQLQAQLARSLPQAKQIELVTPQRRYPLTLRSIAPSFDPLARTREARLGFAGEMALPGVAGELVWNSERASLPAELLSRRNGRLGVFVVDDSRTRTRATFIALPQAEEGRPTVVSLPPQTRVITLGRFRLNDGDAVSIAP